MNIHEHNWIHNIRSLEELGDPNCPWTMPTIIRMVEELSIELSTLNHYSMIGCDSEGLSYIINPWYSHEKTRGFRIPQGIYGTEFIRHDHAPQWTRKFTFKSSRFHVVILDR